MRIYRVKQTNEGKVNRDDEYNDTLEEKEGIL